jgi:hypothetical protein
MQLVNGTAFSPEQPIFHHRRPLTGNHGSNRLKLIALLLKQLQLLVAGDTREFEGISMTAQHVQARSTDTTGRTKDGNFAPSLQIHLLADADKNLAADRTL